MASHTSPKTITSARKAIGTIICGPEAGTFVWVLQKFEVTNATLYFQTTQKLRHAVRDKTPRHRKPSCNMEGHELEFFVCAWRGFVRTAGNVYPIHLTIRT
jgi:hypothetical protein